MEEQKEKKNEGSNYVTWIVVAIIACIFIGIRVYTKYLEKQNMESLERILEKNPNFFNDMMNNDKK